MKKMLILLCVLSSWCVSSAQLDVRTVIMDSDLKLQLGIYEASMLDSLARVGLTMDHILNRADQQLTVMRDFNRVQSELSIQLQRRNFELNQVLVSTQADLTLCRRDRTALEDTVLGLEKNVAKLTRDVRKYKAQSTGSRTMTTILGALVALAVISIVTSS